MLWFALNINNLNKYVVKYFLFVKLSSTFRITDFYAWIDEAEYIAERLMKCDKNIEVTKVHIYLKKKHWKRLVKYHQVHLIYLLSLPLRSSRWYIALCAHSKCLPIYLLLLLLFDLHSRHLLSLCINLCF